jgi:hypothetical protein
MPINTGEIINGNIYYNFNINWYGLGNIKMMENIVSIGLTTICGVMAIYSFIRSQSN